MGFLFPGLGCVRVFCEQTGSHEIRSLEECLEMVSRDGMLANLQVKLGIEFNGLGRDFKREFASESAKG